MQMLARFDPMSLSLHGVGHDGRLRSDVAGLAPMIGGDPGPQAMAGVPARHIPVLVGEVIANLAPHDGGVYIDGTFGAGGYTATILAAARTKVVGIDRDPTAIAAAQPQVEAADGRLTLVK